jgi:hypothetical protein
MEVIQGLFAKAQAGDHWLRKANHDNAVTQKTLEYFWGAKVLDASHTWPI